MILVGKEITLHGITQKGKNRIREHGHKWVVLAETDRVLFAPESPGRWIFIAPVGQSASDTSSRWIRADIDPDFSINW